LGQRLGLEAELWDPKDARFDLRGIYGVGPRTELLFGVDRLGGDNDAFVGVRQRLGAP